MIAHGIDLVEVSSTARLLADPTDQLLTRCFTAQEQVSAGNGVDRAARFSARFAVKEAVMKALGTGFGGGIGFLDIETVTLTSGAPTIVLHGEAQRHAEMLGIGSWLVSTSHEGDIAIASVIGLADQGAPR
ncbi:MAG: holo-ACP synthase [Candidatus Andeanibacterium colombiense]|uniref:Holo-[acyl-carrier-protein] synthase n=1 Tax=Candidatus Andeanibacterium colombiense TaxID=3121345 RepID=A0AAJ5X9K8_9SPHN|nr:MAG: holo-ACP synthase [Sphingomonadaceae bacterium]